LLRTKLGDIAEVLIWNQETFEPTKTYIESIEKELQKVDFAVLVLTEDDERLYRKTKAFVPRDNVVFELGLFIAKLGRERSFYIQPSGVKLPTDLLGIESIKFELPKRSTGWAPVSARRNSLAALPGEERDTLRATLHPACSKVAAAILKVIQKEPSRQKLTDTERAVQKDRRRFYDQIEGAWWERIRFNGEVQALSFFSISADEVYNSVRLEGEAYGKDGALRAEWRSAGARLEDGRILYVRECSHYIPGTTPKWLPGLGEFNFVPASSGRIEKGSGKFSEGDETQPEKTIIKAVELRRVWKDKHKSVMETGSERAKEELVRLVLDKKRSPVF
jgi:hypothetical protein